MESDKLNNMIESEECAGRQRKVCHPVLLCVILCCAVCVCSLMLQGCSGAPDVLSQEPVIPLTDSPHEKEELKEGHEAEGYPELHLEGKVGDVAGSGRDKESAGTGRSMEDIGIVSENGRDPYWDSEDEITAGASDDAEYEIDGNDGKGAEEDIEEKKEGVRGGDEEDVEGKTDGTGMTENKYKTDSTGNDYEVEGVQLSEKQLEKLSAYFNLKNVNPYLQQVYLIPEDFDPDAENDPINIICVAGSCDSNHLYSIFYKKEGSNALWNVVMRRNDADEDEERSQKSSGKYTQEESGGGLLTDGTYRFHSNRLLDPTRETQSGLKGK